MTVMGRNDGDGAIALGAGAGSFDRLNKGQRLSPERFRTLRPLVLRQAQDERTTGSNHDNRKALSDQSNGLIGPVGVPVAARTRT